LYCRVGYEAYLVYENARVSLVCGSGDGFLLGSANHSRVGRKTSLLGLGKSFGYELPEVVFPSLRVLTR
jgi:hypothetical protein